LKILLVGRNGQVGWELEKALQPLGTVLATDRAALDLADGDAVRRVIREAKPDLIVNAAAYTAVDKAESEPDVAMQINGVAPGVMAEEAKRLGAMLVHYSSDYVFDGRKTSPYTEDDVPNPLGAYGRSKLEGDQRIRASGCRHLILRTSWVYGPRGKNFYLTIARKAAAGEPLRVVNDQRGVPTTSGFLADNTLELLRRQAAGLVNLVPSGETTWYEFAREIVRLAGSRSGVDPITTEQFPTAARRPRYSVLDKARAEKALGRPLPDWRTLLAQLSTMAAGTARADG
jgi:dTDP-4-dehydrorhamnose reductase